MDDYLAELIEDDKVSYEEEVWKVDDSELEEIQNRNKIKGGVVVVVSNNDGELLLIDNAWMDGYGLPGGGVELHETWPEAAVREAQEETGIAVKIIRPWHVLQAEFSHKGKRYGSEFTVFYLAKPIDDLITGDDLGLEDEIIKDADWFGTPPANISQPELIDRIYSELLTE